MDVQLYVYDLSQVSYSTRRWFTLLTRTGNGTNGTYNAHEDGISDMSSIRWL